MSEGLIKKVVLQNSLVSWANIIENGLSRGQLANVVPGALKHLRSTRPGRPTGAAAAFDRWVGRCPGTGGSCFSGRGRLTPGASSVTAHPDRLRFAGMRLGQGFMPRRWRKRMNLSCRMPPPSSGWRMAVESMSWAACFSLPVWK